MKRKVHCPVCNVQIELEPSNDPRFLVAYHDCNGTRRAVVKAPATLQTKTEGDVKWPPPQESSTP